MTRIDGIVFILACTCALASGCASSSLKQPGDYAARVRAQPMVLAIGVIQDDVDCDDEGLYLQSFIDDNMLFADCVLADPDQPDAHHDADVWISGTIGAARRHSRRSGWATFAGILTLGAYPLIGAPTRSHQNDIQYTFTAHFADRDTAASYTFTDRRRCLGGMYGPYMNMDHKPDLYEPGWRRLLYELNNDIRRMRDSP